MTSASAPGKIILFGEHAVVYGRPAIAIPVTQVHATVSITPFPEGDKGQIYIEAPDVDYSSWLHEARKHHPLRHVITLSIDAMKQREFPALRLRIESSIPIAAGLGSSAAISVAIVRALGEYFDQPLSAKQQSDIAFFAEKIQHGSASGIDNTVVAFERPVFFIQGELPKPFRPGAALNLLIADTGVASKTSQTVGEVKVKREAEKAYVETIFDQIAELTEFAKRAIISGQIMVVGPLMNQNHVLLQALGVSSPELDLLVQTAREAGAFGSKLSGAGQGGNMIALVQEDKLGTISEALTKSGASRVIRTRIEE